VASLAEETKQRIYELLDGGLTPAQTARELGLHRYTVHRCAAKRITKPVQFPAPTTLRIKETQAAVDEMRAAVEKVQGGFNDDDEPMSLVWQREEERAARKVRKAHESSQFRWRAPGPHLLLAFVSDQHIAPGTPVDFKSMREDAELIRSTPNCYAVLAGDGIDNHIKHKAAILAARSQPEDQLRLFEYYLQILGERSLLVISGNHDNWTTAFAGMDVLGRCVRDQRLAYAPDEAYLDIGVGTQSYTVGVRHQYRLNSTFNETHAVKQWLRLGEREFDIGCIAHHHTHATEDFTYRGKRHWGCRPGSYQITSAYSRQYGFNKSIPTTPTVLLRGDRRHITGFGSLRDALDAPKALCEMGIAA